MKNKLVAFIRPTSFLDVKFVYQDMNMNTERTTGMLLFLLKINIMVEALKI